MKLMFIVFMSMMLTACSGQPSEADIKLALQTELKESNDEVKKMQKMLTIEDEKKEPVKVSEDTQKSENASDDLETAFQDIGKAMNSVVKVVDKTVDTAIAPVFESQMYELVDAKKLGDCITQENPAQYKCKVKATLKNNSGTSTHTTDIIFIRSESGEWISLYED